VDGFSTARAPPECLAGAIPPLGFGKRQPPYMGADKSNN
jgi:hypothetical protein